MQRGRRVMRRNLKMHKTALEVSRYSCTIPGDHVGPHSEAGSVVGEITSGSRRHGNLLYVVLLTRSTAVRDKPALKNCPLIVQFSKNIVFLHRLQNFEHRSWQPSPDFFIYVSFLSKRHLCFFIYIDIVLQQRRMETLNPVPWIYIFIFTDRIRLKQQSTHNDFFFLQFNLLFVKSFWKVTNSTSSPLGNHGLT